MKRLPVLLLTVAWVAGCNRPDPDTGVRLNQIEERLVVMDAAVKGAEHVASLPKPPTDEDLARDERLSRVEQALSNIAARIQTLEKAAPAPLIVTTQAVNAASTPPAAHEEKPGPVRPTPAPANRGPVISIYNAGDSRAADFLVTPAGDAADLFPVRVNAIKGRRVVTGTHPTTRLVESDEVYKDEFGVEKNRRKEVTEQVNEYAYEVVFDLENLTRTEKRITVSAGEVRRPIVLQPGEVRPGLALPSQLGASLRVESGADFKRYTIPYE